MGCGLEEYRARIGGWACRWRCLQTKQSTVSIDISFFCVILAVLLVIGCVELNPGPDGESAAVKCATCKKNLRTGLLCSGCCKWNHFSCQKVKRDQHIEENWRCKDCSRDDGPPDVIQALRNELEDLRGKLSRAEEKIISLEDELKKEREQRANMARAEKRSREEEQRPGQRGITKDIVVIGDSIVRHVGHHHQDLGVECYPGIRVEETKRIIEQRDRGDPKKIIVHVGTNDLRRRSVDYIMGDLYDLATATRKRYPAAAITISGVLRRQDVHWKKIGRVNEAFEWVADRLEMQFLDPNSWLDDRDYGRDGLHLNRRGAATLGAVFKRAASSRPSRSIRDGSAE